MALWNPWGMCNERLNYCRSLEYDILGLPELHNVQNKKLWRNKCWITSEDAGIDEQGKCTDPAAGVAILLSSRFAKTICAQGSVGTRIVWVRLQGPVCSLFVVCAYIPHKYKKTKPCASDVLNDLKNLLKNCKKLKPTDCIIILGDFNCELQRNVPGCTGRWCMNQRPDNGHSEEVMDLLRTFDLFAVDSLFRPKKKCVTKFSTHKRVCNATYLQKEEKRRPKKLDYFFVSNRWKSSVTNSKTNWAPSVHRFGKRFDHCLLSITWSWRVKRTKCVARWRVKTTRLWTQRSGML